MPYVDGFVIPIPRKNLKLYGQFARLGKRVWMKHGALDYKECVAEDVSAPFGLAFPKGLRVKAGETVVFSYIVFKSRAHRDAVNARVMKDPLMGTVPKKMPFDVKRILYGGFRVLVGA